MVAPCVRSKWGPLHWAHGRRKLFKLPEVARAPLAAEAVRRIDLIFAADCLRHALAARGTPACIPSRKDRKVAIPHDTTLYRQRYRIENMFGRLKDWRRIHTRYDRCAHAFISAIALAAIVIFWINES